MPKCDTWVSAFLFNLYESICCPDPCYEPHWEPAAYASLFADYARPRTVTRLRYDNLTDLVRPDRNQYFLKQTRPAKIFTIHGVRYRTDPSLKHLQQLSLYQEAAGAMGSFFVEIPYRQINPLFSPTQAGFSDINFGLKSLFFDTELLQLAFQFRTYTPSGNSFKGLGTGNFSLDPSLMASLKLGPETYFQGQLGQWVPLGGTAPPLDPNDPANKVGGTRPIPGGILYWFTSFNQVLLWCTPDSPLIGTLEMDGWSFENGGFTKPVINDKLVKGNPIQPFRGTNPSVRTSGGGVSYFNIGPGLRWSICNRIDFGGAITWSTTSLHWADPWFRFEVRFLF